MEGGVVGEGGRQGFGREVNDANFFLWIWEWKGGWGDY